MTKQIVAILAAMLLSFPAHARITGTVPASADIHCVGPSGAETCTDASGNFIPTTDNDATLGTSSLRWSGIHSYDLSLSDDLTVADDATVTGDLFKVMAATVTVIDGSTIGLPDGACGGILRLEGTTDVQTDETNTITAPSASNAGCVVILVSVASSNGRITLDDNALFDTGAGYPSAGSLVLGTNDVVMIMSLGTKWTIVGTITDH